MKSRRRAFTQGLPGFSAALGSSTRVSPSEPRPTPEQQQAEQQQAQRREEMNQRVVDFLDAVDPEVSTVSTLNNIQNSLFIPNFGSWVNRGSLIKLSSPEVRAAGKYAQLLEEHEALEARGQSVDDRPPVEIASHGAEQEYARALEERRRVAGQPTSRTSLRPQSGEPPASLAEAEQGEAEKARERAQHPEQFDHQRVQASTPVMGRRRSVASALSSATGPKLRHRQTVRGDFAVLPPGVDWGDWTDEEKAELDDYVYVASNSRYNEALILTTLIRRHLLHSKKEKSKRVWRGFKKYFSTPLGAFVTIYSFLLFVWGLAWVLFIIGWINVGGRQAYFIEICDQVCCQSPTGLGLANVL